MTVNGQPADRRSIHVELERAGTDLHQLVASATSAELRRRTDGTRWTNQQMLWHMAFGYLIVSRLLRLVRASGYVPLTPVLWSWLSIGERDESLYRYLLAAARRLDQANEMLTAVQRHEDAANEGAHYGPTFRRHVFALIGAVESTVVALGRAIDMAGKAADLIGTSAELPEAITRLSASVTAIRNAYEHIEDRALGTVFGKPDPVALTIFDHGTLLREDTIVYGDHRLTLDDLRTLIADTRQFLKDAAKGPVTTSGDGRTWRPLCR